MKKLKFIFISIPFYLIATLSIVVYILTDLHPRITISPEGRLFLLGIFTLFVYIGGRIICKSPTISTNKVMKVTFLVFFLLYLSLLLTFTLFDPMFGRNNHISFIFSDRFYNKNYLSNSFNIIPFATIIEYINGILTQSMTPLTIIYNLFGNLVALTPMALFLPLFFSKCEKFKHFLFSTIGIVIVIEMLQFIFVTGSCDIDDLILNVFGACIAFIILEVKPIKKMVNLLIPIDKHRTT